MLEPVRESYRSGKSLHLDACERVPDFVYFDHSIHINKGVGCNSPVTVRWTSMPLMYAENTLQMEFCLNCHREPEKELRPTRVVFDMTYKQPAQTEAGRGERAEVHRPAALGSYLKKQYHLRSERDITSCNTCHR